MKAGPAHLSAYRPLQITTASVFFTTAPHTRPGPSTNYILCRALTPTEPLMGFGRGLGPAQAANPVFIEGWVWTQDP